MRRLLLVTAAMLAVAIVIAGTATAAKPVQGDWKGSKSLDFTVNAAGTQITEFAPGGCAAGPFPWSMKVAHNGSFKLKKKVGLEGGRPVTMKITGKFTTPTSARGTISYGKCKQKFKATGPAPVQQPTDTMPVDAPAS